MRKAPVLAIIVSLCLIALIGCSETTTSENPPADEQEKEVATDVVDESNDDIVDTDTPQDTTETAETAQSSTEANTTESTEQDTAQESTTTDGEVVNSVSDEQSKLARDYNTKGFRLYKEGKYKEALDLFKMSYEADDSYCHAHFNYACTLGVLMKSEYEDYYLYKDDVIDHLEKVIKLDSKYVEKVKTDADLEPIRKEFGYYTRLLGLTTSETEDVKALLQSLNWYIEGPGVMTILGGMEFKGNSNFTISFLDIRDFSNGIESISYNGTYTLEGNTIKFTLSEKMLYRRSLSDINNFDKYDDTLNFTGTLTEDGMIKIDIFEYPISWCYEEFSA